ncbi:hypothetical protein K402DRAFT_304186, partial [Aulographum hederae CBS 113979]
PKPPQKKPPLTHFLCLPLVTSTSRPQLERSLKQFRDDVTKIPEPQEASVEPIPEGATRPLGTLHLTLGVMSLTEQGRVEEAVELLKGLDLRGMLNEALRSAVAADKRESNGKAEGGERKDASLTISLSSLSPMHSPKSTSILYALPTDPTKRLYPFASTLQSAFTSAGFLLADDRPLKLHATVVNTIYAAGGRRRDGNGGKRKKFFKIDARDVLERYRGFAWAEDVRIERVAICKMGAKK